MAGPMSMYLYVHEAILREVADVENVLGSSTETTRTKFTRLANVWIGSGRWCAAMRTSEEQFLFPAMNDRIRFVAETYEFDHDDFDVHVFEGIDQAFRGLVHADGNLDRLESAELLFRQSVALHEHMRLHISKENELLIPKLEVESMLPEQAEIAGAMAGVFDPQLMAETVNFTYGWHTADNREGMIRFLRGILPEEAFGGLTNHLKSNNADSWPEIERRIPDL